MSNQAIEIFSEGNSTRLLFEIIIKKPYNNLEGRNQSREVDQSMIELNQLENQIYIAKDELKRLRTEIKYLREEAQRLTIKNNSIKNNKTSDGSTSNQHSKRQYGPDAFDPYIPKKVKFD